MKELKRRQFLAFFTDFFEKHKEGNAKYESTGFRFKESEKAKLLDKYFKKYYMENRMPRTKTINLGIKPAGKGQRPTQAKVEILVDTVADENKDAFLGRSEGIKNSYKQKALNKDVVDVLEERLSRSMARPKVFGHGLHGANVKNVTAGATTVGVEEKSVKGFSRLSHNVSPIPRESGSVTTK